MPLTGRTADSSDEEGAHRPGFGPALPKKQENSRSVGTQTDGSMMDALAKYAERSSLIIQPMSDLKNQFWASVLACAM